MENFIFYAVSKTWQSKKIFSAVMWTEQLKEHIKHKNKQTNKKRWNSRGMELT